MKLHRLLLAAAALALGLLTCLPAHAQAHRATRLGHPATRFAPPLTQPEQLRKLLRDEALRADVEEILRQAKWDGDVEDLRRAAATNAIVEYAVPSGTRMPFMSSREGGRPVALIDVLWDGPEPIAAYAFDFESKGRRYRCITPRPCSNFYVIELPRPALRVLKTAPAEAGLCEPFEMKLTVWNAGAAPAMGVRVIDTLPAGLTTTNGQTTVTFDAGTLNPDRGRQFAFTVQAAAPGRYTNVARAVCAQGATTEGEAVTRVRAPVLALEAVAPPEVIAGRLAEVCLKLRNTGDVPERRVTVTLPIPEDATWVSSTAGGVKTDGLVTWEFPDLAPQASREVCATFTRRQPGALTFTAAARGQCATAVQARAETRMAGIAAVLLEVIDLEDPIEVGQQVVYQIKVLNQGSAPVTNVRLNCALPGEQDFLSGTGATTVTAEGSAITMEPLAALAPKAEAVWRVTVKAQGAGDVRFKVELAADQFQQRIEETESTQQY